MQMKIASDAAEAASDEIAQAFVDGGVEIAEFTRSYMEVDLHEHAFSSKRLMFAQVRKLYHARSAKIARIQMNTGRA
jgi:hypothetical protein